MLDDGFCHVLVSLPRAYVQRRAAVDVGDTGIRMDLEELSHHALTSQPCSTMQWGAAANLLAILHID